MKRMKHMTFTIGAELIEKLELETIKRGTTKSALIRSAMYDYFEKEK